MVGNPNHDEEGKFSGAQSKVAQALNNWHESSQTRLKSYNQAKIIRDKLDAAVTEARS